MDYFRIAHRVYVYGGYVCIWGICLWYGVHECIWTIFMKPIQYAHENSHS